MCLALVNGFSLFHLPLDPTFYTCVYIRRRVNENRFNCSTEITKSRLLALRYYHIDVTMTFDQLFFHLFSYLFTRTFLFTFCFSAKYRAVEHIPQKGIPMFMYCLYHRKKTPTNKSNQCLCIKYIAMKTMQRIAKYAMNDYNNCFCLFYIYTFFVLFDTSGKRNCFWTDVISQMSKIEIIRTEHKVN